VRRSRTRHRKPEIPARQGEEDVNVVIYIAAVVPAIVSQNNFLVS
jgi:hypothetical protein